MASALPSPPSLAPHPYEVGDVVSNSVKVLRSRLGFFIGQTLLPTAFLLLTMTASVVVFLLMGGVALFTALSTGSSRRIETAMTAAMGGVVVASVLYVVALLGYALLLQVAQGRMAVATLEVLDGKPATPASVKEATPGLLGRAAALVGLGIGAYIALWIVLVIIVIVIAAVGGLSISQSSRSASGALFLVGNLAFLVLYVGLVVVSVIISVRLVYLNVLLAQGHGPIGAIKGSWAVTKGKFWRTLGYQLVGGLIVYVASMAVFFISYVIMLAFSMVGVAAGSASSDPVGQVAASLVGMVPGLIIFFVLNGALALLSVPFMVIYTTLMYRDQLVRDANPHLVSRAPSFVPGQPAQPAWQPQQPYQTPQYPAQPGYGPAPQQGAPTYGQPPAGQPTYGQATSGQYGPTQPASPHPSAQQWYGPQGQG